MVNYYLSPYIGAGTYRDPFRPALNAAGWSAIDLRPNHSVIAGNCLVALPSAAGSLPSGAISLGTGGALSVALRTQLGNALGVTLTQSTIANIAAELLIDLAGGARWKPLVAHRAGNVYRQEIFLGGLLWWRSMAMIAGASTIGDDFNRANSTTIGGSWVEDLDNWSIASNALTNAGVGDAEIRFNASLAGNNQFAQVVANLAGTRGCGTMVRHPASSTRDYYVASVFNTTSRELHVRTSAAGGAYTQLAAPVTPAITFPGTIRTEANGSTISGLWNGVAYSTVTDTTITSGPQTGIYMYLAGSSATSDDYLAGDLPGGLGGKTITQAIRRAANY